MLFRHRKIIAWVLILLVFLPVHPAYADDPGSAAFPSIDELFGGQNRSPYLTEYKDNYYLDMVDYNFFKNPEGSLNGAANVIFKLQYYVAYLLVVVFYYAFEIDLYEIFSGLIGTFVTEMKTTMFDELSMIGIVLLGLFYVIKILQDQKTQVWVAIIQTVVIVALATFFFTDPMSMLKQVDKASKELSKSVLTGTYRASRDGNGNQTSAVIAAANDIWMMFVHKPWQLLEFGNTSLAAREEAKILSLPPGSEQRKELIKNLAKDKKHFAPDWGPSRLGFMAFYLIPMLIMAVCILLLCLLMLAYQFLTILYALMGVFIFVLALIPFFGIRIVESWFSKIIGTAGIKVVVCFCLGILFAFNSALFKLADVYGWIVLLILQIVVVVVIVWKKDALFETFTMIRLAPQNAGAINKQLRRDTNIEGRIRDYSRNAKLGKGYRYSDVDEEDVEMDAEYVEEDSGGVKTRRNSGYNGRDYGDATFNQLVQEVHEDSTNDNENFRQFMKKAEEILEKQYELSKEASEVKAEKLGKEPEYTPLVYKVDTREALGAPRFEQREIVAVAQELQRVVKAGGRAEDLYHQDAKVAVSQTERPSSVMDIVVHGQKISVDQQEAEKLDAEKATKEYTGEFNRDYGTGYDHQFMEALVKKYGQYQVRLVMDKMKDRREKEGNIKNPAGYLTQSLKNNAKEQMNMRKKASETNTEMKEVED